MPQYAADSERGSIDRRTFLRRATSAGTLAAAAGFAGCLGGGGGTKQAPADIEKWPPQDVENQLSMWNWYDDWVDWAQKEFEKSHEVSVSNNGFSSPSQWYAKLQAGDAGIDNISGTTNWIERCIENDLLYELPVDLMPNWGNITQRMKDIDTYRKDGKVYAVPEDMVLYSLTYNTDRFGNAPKSWGVLWDESLKGKITMWDNSRVSCQIAALYTGQNPINPKDFQEIKEVLIQQKPLVKTYWSDYQQGMSLFINQAVLAGPLTMGRTYMARFRKGAPVHYTVPTEGTIYTSDMFIIPKGAPHPMASLAFTNWASQTKSAAKLFELMGYKPAVDISKHLSTKEREFISWSDTWNLVFSKKLSDKVRSRYDKIWTAVKSA